MAVQKSSIGVHKDADSPVVFSGLRELGGPSDGGVDATRRVVSSLDDEFPVVAQLLGGVPKEGKMPELAGGSISFYVRDGKLKFTASVKSMGKVFYGEVADPLKPWEGVNWAMMTNQVSSKGYTERPNGSQAVPEDVKLY